MEVIQSKTGDLADSCLEIPWDWKTIKYESAYCRASAQCSHLKSGTKIKGRSSYHTHVLGSAVFRLCEATMPCAFFYLSRALMLPCPKSKVWFLAVLLSYNQMSKMPKFGGPYCLNLQSSRRLQ